MPYLFSLLTSISWFITSKAFDKSQNIAKVNSGLVSLLISVEWLRNCMIGWIVEYFGGYQYRCLWNILCEFKKTSLFKHNFLYPKCDDIIYVSICTGIIPNIVIKRQHNEIHTYVLKIDNKVSISVKYSLNISMYIFF